MAERNLDDLLIEIDATTEKLRREMRRGTDQVAQFQRNTDRHLKKIDQRFDRLGDAVNKFKGRLAAAAGAAAGGAGFAGIVRGAQNAAAEFDALAKAADTRGLSTDFYQALQLAAEEAGVKQELLNSSLTAFAKRVGEARAGGGALMTTLKRMDAGLLEALQNTQSQEEALRLLSNAMAGLTSSSDRAALASAAFSRAGVELVRVFGNGSRALDDTAAKARELGIVVDERILRNMEQVNNDFGVATRVIDLQFKQALIAAAPVIKDFAEGLASVAVEVRQFFESFREPAERSTFILQKNISDAEDRLRTLDERIANLRRRRAEIGNEDNGLFGFGNLSEAFEAEQLESRLSTLVDLRETLNEKVRENARALARARRNAEFLAAQTRNVGDAADEAADNAERFARGLSTSIEPVRGLENEVQRLGATGQAVAGGIDSLISTAFSNGKLAAEDFQGVLQSMLADITRMIVRTQVLRPLLTGGAGGGLLAGVFHSGGTVGAGGVGRQVSPLAFAGAPRLHDGLGANEFPAILERGERVIPRGEAQGSGARVSAPVNVTIDARGADSGAAARIEAVANRLRNEIPARAVAAVADAKTRGVL